jgi:ADP-L-glycero-D-manno-heptose 6-epimerase
MSSRGSSIYLVTGAAGFIGARFVESCNARSIAVISVDEPEHFRVRPENHGLNYGPIIPRSDLIAWLEKEKPALSAIVHIGARTDTAEKDENIFAELNVRYSQNLWNYASANKIPFVYASSAATYGDGTRGFDDDEAAIPSLQALNPYGLSKQIFDVWALEQEKQGNHPPAWSGFKFFNVYGFGERHKKFMASVVLHAYEQALRDGRITLFKSHKDGIADGHQARDFIYVDDVVNVLQFAAKQPIERGVYNLGTGRARTYLDLAHAVFSALGMPPKVVFVPTPESIRAGYQYFTQAKMDRLRAQGYAPPFTTIEAGIRAYVEKLQGGR